MATNKRRRMRDRQRREHNRAKRLRLRELRATEAAIKDAVWRLGGAVDTRGPLQRMIDEAATYATAENPVTIRIEPGTYIENICVPSNVLLDGNK